MQAVERCVKLVTEAFSLVCGQNSRDGFIHSKIESRQKMPSFEKNESLNLIADDLNMKKDGLG